MHLYGDTHRNLTYISCRRCIFMWFRFILLLFSTILLCYRATCVRGMHSNAGERERVCLYILVFFFAIARSLALSLPLVILSIKCKYVIIVSIWVCDMKCLWENVWRSLSTLPFTFTHIAVRTHTHTRAADIIDAYRAFAVSSVRRFPPPLWRHHYDTYRLEISVADGGLTFMVTKIIHGKDCKRNKLYIEKKRRENQFFARRKVECVQTISLRKCQPGEDDFIKMLKLLKHIFNACMERAWRFDKNLSSHWLRVDNVKIAQRFFCLLTPHTAYPIPIYPCYRNLIIREHILESREVCYCRIPFHTHPSAESDFSARFRSSLKTIFLSKYLQIYLNNIDGNVFINIAA